MRAQGTCRCRNATLSVYLRRLPEPVRHEDRVDKRFGAVRVALGRVLHQRIRLVQAALRHQRRHLPIEQQRRRAVPLAQLLHRVVRLLQLLARAL